MAIKNKTVTSPATKVEDAEEVVEQEAEEDDSEALDEDEGSDAGTTTDEVDYSELFKNEEERDKAQKAIATAKYGERRAKRETPEDEDEAGEPDEEDDKPITLKDVKRIQREAEVRTEKRLQEREAHAIALRLTGSEDGARAVSLYWKNRVIPTGDLQADVEFAYGGLHHKKLSATNSELARALKNKDGVGSGPSSPHGGGDSAPAPKLATDMAASMKRAGYVYGKDKQWRKQLPNGNTLILDPKTRKTTLLRKPQK